jgi:hypothetical protein
MKTNREVKPIRAAIRGPKGNFRPIYGVPQPDGSLLADGQSYSPDEWFASRPSKRTDDDNEDA